MNANNPDAAALGKSREQVLLFLTFLTSEACWQACSRALPPDRLALALCRLWFDEIYVPSMRYLDGLKGDRSEDAVRRFQACFTPPELTTLERFHRFFELRMDLLAPAAGQPLRIVERDVWRSILKDASYVLEELTDDPVPLRRQLEQVLVEQGPDGLVRCAGLSREASTWLRGPGSSR
jgi:hypothetical protein